MSSASLSEVGYSTVPPPSLLYDPSPAHIYVTTDRLDDDDYLIPPKSSLIYTLPPRDSTYLLLSPPFPYVAFGRSPPPNTYSSFLPLGSAVCPFAAGASMSAVL